MSSTSCGVTVLRSRGPRFAKTLHGDGPMTPYGDARTVDLATIDVADLAALHVMLGHLILRPDLCIVRAAIADPGRVHGVRRLLHPDPDTGDQPTLREVPRRWLALDMDDLAAPAGIDVTDLAACSAAARLALPHDFRDAALIVQASASHGVKPGLRLRVWCWLSRPMMGQDAQRWLRGVPGLDLATLRPAQVIYTAAPILTDGATDPLPHGRLHVSEGAPVVQVPDLPDPTPPPRLAFRSAPIHAGDTAGRRLAALVSFAAINVPRQRNDRLYWATCRAAALVQDGHVDAATARAAMAEAGRMAGLPPQEADATVASALRMGGGA